MLTKTVSVWATEVISRKRGRVEIQISNHTLQEWEQERAAPGELAEPQLRKAIVHNILGKSCWRKSLLYVNHVYPGFVSRNTSQRFRVRYEV